MSITVKIGNTPFMKPFRANGFYVQDAARTTVCETPTREIAIALAKMLNQLP